jgi:GTP-binding protein
MKKPHNLEKFFNGKCDFVMGVQKADQVPDSKLPEIAFIGRSNVGKSTLINATVNKKIALTSKTPGRTRQLNFFLLEDMLSIVDMPGYGYAKVSKKDIEEWEKLSYRYFSTRANLKRVFLLIDSRRGIEKKDEEMINIFNTLAVSYQLVLTKIDELKPAILAKVIAEITEKSKKFPAVYPVILATSSNHDTGINELRKAIVDLM